MVDFVDSSQLNKWLFASTDELRQCREKANALARQKLSEESPSSSSTTPVHFACGYPLSSSDATIEAPWNNKKENPFLNAEEETTLVSFYVSKIPALIGPKATVSRLRRESKVTATASLLLRRFFLSNSVMMFDPKVMMVAAAFLASKVEDAMADARYLEEGTTALQSPVALSEIIAAEVQLLEGIHFDLLCFHPYKAVLALTEDLRTYLKSDKGQSLVEHERILSGQDLKPIYDKARIWLEDAMVSDLPLLYSPGQIGLASMMVAQEELVQKDPKHPKIDLPGYVRQRFDQEKVDEPLQSLQDLCEQLKALRTGDHGCGNYFDDLHALKAIHKKLKKVRIWGDKKRKKKGDEEPSAKRVKTEG